MKGFLLSFGIGAIIGLLHNFALKFLIIRAVSCYYEAGCVVSDMHAIAVDSLYFPISATSSKLDKIVSINPENKVVLISILWAIFSTLLVWVLVSYRQRNSQLRHGL